LLEELQDSEPRDCSSDDDSSGTDDLAVGEVNALECSNNVRCVCTFHANGNNREAYTMIIFFKKLYFGYNNTHKNYILVFGCVISMDQFESICNYMHFSNNESTAMYRGPSKL
jgi:hypothetical protein